MARKLPPLNALRYFEVAARRLSFKEAAKELNVTASAISHQVQNLETFLDIRLFHRYKRKLALTDAGALYLAKIRPVFDDIDEATRDISTWGTADVLSLAVPPSLLANWLIFRLRHFIAERPDVQIRLVDTLRPVNFHEEKIDAGIWYGMGDWPNIQVEHLADEIMVPVCSPDLLVGKFPLNGPADLNNYVLIHTERRLTRWDTILPAGGYDHIDFDRGLRFLHSIHSIQAAIQGLGIALVNKINVSDYLVSGELIVPFKLTYDTSRTPGYYFVCPTESAGQPKVEMIRRWIIEEFESVSPTKQ